MEIMTYVRDYQLILYIQQFIKWNKDLFFYEFLVIYANEYGEKTSIESCYTITSSYLI